MQEHVFGNQFAPEGTEEHPMVPVVEVLWNREGGYLQVVSKANSATGGRWAQHLVPEGETTWETHFTDGYYVDLDRRAVNDLIRKLRRARDQAFGRDE